MWKFVTTTNNSFLRRSGFSGVSGVLLFLAAALCVPAHGQLFTDDAARELAASNAEKLENLARVVQNMRGQVASLQKTQQDADQKLRELLGKMEESSARAADKNALKEVRSQISKAVAERRTMSDKITELGEKIEEVGTYVTLPSEQELYETAFADYREKNYDKSVSGFEKVLEYYPEGPFNAGARYWMSQNFMAQKKYDEAAKAAGQIIELHGNSDKAADAMLTLADAQNNLKKTDESRQTLEDLIAKYPTSLAADKARRRLAP